jgi:hypothetical protein
MNKLTIFIISGIFFLAESARAAISELICTADNKPETIIVYKKDLSSQWCMRSGAEEVCQHETSSSIRIVIDSKNAMLKKNQELITIDRYSGRFHFVGHYEATNGVVWDEEYYGLCSLKKDKKF